MNHFFSRPGFSFDEEEQQQKQQNGAQQKMDTRRPNSSTSLFGDMDYSSGGIQYRHGNGGSQQQQQQQQQYTRNRSKSFSCEPPPPLPPPAEAASELPKSPKQPKVTFADDEENRFKNSDQKQQQQQKHIDTREELVKRLQQNLASWKKQSNVETVADTTAFNRNDISFSALQHAQNGGGENQHTFSSQQLAAMKTVVYLDLKTTTTAEEFEEEETAAKAACPVCSLSQPLAHWHYLLPSRATYQLQALPVLVDALPTSCSVCARVPRGGSGSGLKLCSKCRAVVYCSEECQLEDWRRGHGRQCEKEESRKVVKSFGEVDCLEGENNGGHFNGSGGQQQQQQQQQFFGRGSQHPYRGHQQQFFTRQRVRSEMYPQHQQQQGPPRSDDFFLNRFNSQRNSANQQVPQVQPTNQAALSVPAAAASAPASATAPAQTAPVPVSSTPAPKAAPAPVSEPTPPAPKAALPSPVAATAPKITETTTTTKYQLKPMPLEAMQHAELKDVTDGPWKRGGLKDAAMEVPAFPKEFLENEKEEKEKEEEQVNNNNNNNHHHQPNRERSPAAPRAIPEATKKAEPLQSLQIPSASSPPPVSPFAEKYFDGVVSKLPHFQLTTGKAYSLMPVELEESVDRKRVSFYVGYRDFIGKLMVEINKLAPQCAQVEMADIEAGDVYLVKYDSEWFRGQVLRVTSTSFYVDYFDFGNRKYVDRREVAAVAGKGGGGGYFRQLPPSIGIKRQPPMAIRVQVRNIPSFQQYNLVKRLVTEGIHKHTLLKLFVLEYCPETDCYTVQLDEI